MSASAPVREALRKINALSGGTMVVFALDAGGRVVGSLTDGDIRRALIEDADLEMESGRVANKGFLAIRPGDDRYAVIAEARRRSLVLLPELDSYGRLAGLTDLTRTKAALPMEAVLMAGGKGERLRPLTLDCPKPLLKVGGKAIIDYNVDELLSVGVSRISVTVNYLKEQLTAHFDTPEYAGKVTCVEEPCRLGTMGSLALVSQPEQPYMLVMNSDLLTTIDFEALYRHHRKTGADLTMAVVPYTVSIPFSIIRHEGGWVSGLTEKPTFNYFAGAGVYLMNSGLKDRIEFGKYLDAPDFVASLIADGLKVGHYQIEGRWIDIGSPDDYRYACEIMR